LSDEVIERLAEEAAQQSITPEELAAHTLAEYVVTRPHHGSGTIDKPAPAATEHAGSAAAAPGDRQHRPRRSLVRLIGYAPSALWVGLFLLFYAAMFILIVALIAQAL
jgi:hypothetical protein